MTARSRRVVVGLVAPFALVAVLAACGSDRKKTDFDAFVDRYDCASYDRQSDGDIDMTCVEPANDQRVAVQFDANDEPGKYVSESEFAGKIQVFTKDEVEDSRVYDDKIDEDSGSVKKKKKRR